MYIRLQLKSLTAKHLSSSTLTLTIILILILTLTLTQNGISKELIIFNPTQSLAYSLAYSGMQSSIISLGAGVRKKVSLNTHAVLQKNQSCRIMNTFAESLKGHLKSYLTNFFQVLLPLVTDKHSAEIRSSASLALAKTFEATVDAVKKGFTDAAAAQEVLTACVRKLLEALKGEVNSSARGCAAGLPLPTPSLTPSLTPLLTPSLTPHSPTTSHSHMHHFL